MLKDFLFLIFNLKFLIIDQDLKFSSFHCIYTIYLFANAA